ncbi:MAG TPA: carbohydrate ABC transporter permease [Caldilineae bacterium]|nr:carbohydrate ABC transporter permease [Caldilineae bacterium]
MSQEATSTSLYPRREIQVPSRWQLVLVHWAGRVALYTVVSVLSLVFALPLLWMISTSLKTDPQVYHVPPIWIPNPIRFANYLEVLTRRPFGLWFLNTLRYCLPSTFGAIASATLVAYSFSRIRWPGRDFLFYVCLSTMMIPFQVRMIPLYIIFRHLGWINSYKALVIPTFFGEAYFIFMLRQFFMTIPGELSDAARVDGCSELGILLRIIMPLAKPALAVVGLFQFMGAWNDYLGPLIYLNRESLFPLALGLQSMRSSFQEALVWPYLMAASTMIIAPIIITFFLTQRTFVEGITVTGLKG